MTLEFVFDKEHCATGWKGPGSLSGRVLGNFNVSFLCPRSVALGSTQPLTDMRTKEVPCGYSATGRRSVSSAVLVVPNVRLRISAQHFVSALSLHDLLRESLNFTFHSTRNPAYGRSLRVSGCGHSEVQLH